MIDGKWAVVCGPFRMEFELYTTLCRLCELRKKGILEGIVISTWKGEADRIPGFREKLKKLSIRMVESEDPGEAARVFGDPAYFRQELQLRAVLELLPENVYILKCRTDFSNFDINRMNFLAGKEVDLKKGEWGAVQTEMQERLVVLKYGISVPFGLHDIAFFGRNSDLKRLLTFESSSLSLGKWIESDIWIFAGYYSRVFRIISDFFRMINPGGFRALVNRISDVTEGDFCLPSFLNRFFALYFVILYTNCRIYQDTAQENFGKLRFSDLFRGRKEAGIRKDWAVDLRSDEPVRQIVEGECIDSPGYRKLYHDIQKMKEPGYAKGLSLSMEDYRELVEWGRKKLHTEPEEWLRPWPELFFEDRSSDSLPGFGEAAELLFPEGGSDPVFLNMIRDITFNTKSYYDTVIRYLDELKARNDSLYKKALFCASRYMNDEVLKRIAELLLTDSLTEYERTEAEYIFKRYAHDERLYHCPMSLERIGSLIDFAMYEEANGGGGVCAQEFCRFVSRFYGCETENSPSVTAGSHGSDGSAESSALEQLRDLVYRIENRDTSGMTDDQIKMREALEGYLGVFEKG